MWPQIVSAELKKEDNLTQIDIYHYSSVKNHTYIAY